MPEIVFQAGNLSGLTGQQVLQLRNQFGKNIFKAERSYRFFRIIWDIVKEPMFILLVIACSLYFVVGSMGEGMLMVAALLLISAIFLFPGSEKHPGNSRIAAIHGTENQCNAGWGENHCTH